MEKRKKADKPEDISITSITVEGFKSIRDETTIELKPLTILAGANSSGKSSIIQPLLLLKQTLECDYDPGALLLDGPNTKFTSSEQLLWKKGDESVDSFKIGIAHNADKIYYTYKRADRRKGFEIENQTWSDSKGKYVWVEKMIDEDIMNNIPEEVKNYINSARNIKQNVECSIKREKCFLTATLLFHTKSKELPFPLTSLPSNKVSYNLIRTLIHLPGLRGNPERVYKNTMAEDLYKGQFQNYTAGIIANWSDNKDKRLKTLAEWLKKMRLTQKIKANRIDDSNIEISIGKFPVTKQAQLNDWVSIADVGLGVSQVLPVLVALLAAKPKQMVYIEQPEIHLHPRARVELAKLIAATAKRGAILIIETHCDIILRTIQTEVAKGKKINKDSVILHWFERGEDGSTKVTSTTIDENGTFGKWPVDFGEVDLKSQMDFIKWSSQRRSEKKNAKK